MISHTIRKYAPPPKPAPVAGGPWYAPVTPDEVATSIATANLGPGALIVYATRTAPLDDWSDISLLLHVLEPGNCERYGVKLNTVMVMQLRPYNQSSHVWSRKDDPICFRAVTPEEIAAIEKKTGVTLDSVRRNCIAEAARRGHAYHGPISDHAPESPQ